MSNDDTTQVDVPPPPRKKRTSFLPEDSSPSVPADNMRREQQVSMTFNMNKSWHREFKSAAVAHDVSMKDILMQGFELWKDAQKAKKNP